MKQDPELARKVFTAPVGFFWQTIENTETFYEANQYITDVNFETQTTMSLVYKKVYRDPRAMMGILNRVLQTGLDLAGLRLVYPTPDLMLVAQGLPRGSLSPRTENTAKSDMLNNIGPIFAFAMRGAYARTVWLDTIGPSDPALARKTDPNSLCALYGGVSRDECLLFSPRDPNRVMAELVRWFGGRVPANGVIDVGSSAKPQDGPSSAKKSKKNLTGIIK